MQITTNPRSQYDTWENAERMIEVNCPAGYCYEIVEINSSLWQVPLTWAVKVYHGETCQFLGYAHKPEGV